VLLLVDCVLLVVLCALIDAVVCAKQCYSYIGIIFLILLQENIGTVKVERVENVEEENCINIKTEEEFCIQLVRRVKSEEEVSVVCWCVLWG
jgi:hypothetical protein